MGGTRLTPVRARRVVLTGIALTDPATLVLDRATSLLDPESVRSAGGSLGGVLSGGTAVAVAHRPHAAQDASRVAIIVGGFIVEFGTHEELLTCGGEYTALWRAWQEE